MVKFRLKLLGPLLIALVFLSCNLPSKVGTVRESSPTPDLVQTFSAPFPTVEDMPSGMVEPTQPVDIPGPSDPAPNPTAQTAAATPIVPTSTSPAPITHCNWAQFLGDVSIPDGTVLQTGEMFVKKWRLKNIGTCTWNQDYRLVFSSGAAMGGPSEVSLPKVVVPGDSVDVLVNLEAPSTPKRYTGYWKLATPAGDRFGVGSTAQDAFYVQIEVTNPDTPVPGMTRVNFFANSTGAQIAGYLDVGQTNSYVLDVQGGQTMLVQVVSPSQNALLRIYGLDTGQVLLENSMGAGQSSWQGLIPSTQDYVIQVINRGDPTDFTLAITIPENIAIRSGSTSASLSSPIHVHETHTFRLKAEAGQTMRLKLSPNDKSVLLAFYGYQDGQFYLKREAGQTSWKGEVPATQDYIVQVISVSGANTDFTLDVSIDN